MNTIQKNAQSELDAKACNYGGDYRTAFRRACAENPELVMQYTFGDIAVVKSYETLSPAQQAMAGLLADLDKVRTLARSVLDSLARRKLQNVGPGVAFPVDEYKRALANVRSANPSLARAATDGFIADSDWDLLALLIPAVAGAVERGEYAADDTRCKRCGENRFYCRGKKLAEQRGIDEDSDVKAFGECILAAREYGDELDKIYCYYK